MSTDIHLLLEYRSAHGWQPALHVADRVEDPRTENGILNVCWWSVRSRPTALFFGDDALFPFNAGLPGDLSARMHEYVWPNFQNSQRYAGWISLPELELASWSRETVLVGGPVQAEYASFFGDGQQPPPIDALVQQGIAEPILEHVTGWKNDRKLTPQAVPFYKLKKMAPDFLVQVTWVEALVDFVGPLIWRDGLARLTELDSPEDYRLVTSIG